MKKRLIVLSVGILGSYIFYSLFISKSLDICDLYCNRDLGHFHRSTMLFPFILFFSLLTFKLPNPIFERWLHFTFWTAPVVFGLTFLINLGLHHSTSDLLGTSDMFEYQRSSYFTPCTPSAR